MGRVASPTKDVAALTPAPVSVAASENRVFADDQAEKGSLGCALTQHDCVLIKGGRLNTETDTGRTLREEEGKIGVMHLDAQQTTRSSGRRLGQVLPCGLRRNQPY